MVNQKLLTGGVRGIQEKYSEVSVRVEETCLKVSIDSRTIV